MPWKTIRLELAQSPDFPQGSTHHAYLMRVPLNAGGSIDASAYEQAREQARIRRMWPDEYDRLGFIIQSPDGWAFTYTPDEMDEPALCRLESDAIRPGGYLSITEADGKRLPYRVVSCDG